MGVMGTKIKPLISFMRKLTGLTVIIVAAILLQTISAVQYYYTRNLLEEELEKRAESELMIKILIVKNTLNMAEHSLEGQQWNIIRNIAYPDSLYGVGEWVLRTHPNLMGCGLAFVPDYYPEKGRLFEPYVYRKPGSQDHEELVEIQASSEEHDYTKMEFYTKTMTQNAPSWSNPYYNEITKRWNVTYCKPISYRDKTIGVYGLDIDLDWLSDTLNYRHIYPSSYDLMLTETGELIAGPKFDDEEKKAELAHVVAMLNDSTAEHSLSRSGRTSVFPITDKDGGKGLVFHAVFKGNPRWRIAVVCYDDEVYVKLLHMRHNIGIMMLLGLLVLGLMVSSFAKNNRRLQRANMKQQRIDSELHIATNIQKEMLPKVFPPYPERNDIDVYGMLIPAREVGGDLYDFFLRDEKLFFCIGDVSGKGVPSAMVMAVIHSLFRMASAHENNPARIMQTINETSCQGNESNMFVTLFVGVLDLPTGHLTYCDAGHDAPIVLRDDSCQLPVTPHLPVGVFADIEYTLQETHIQPDSTLFLYTDGLTEAKNEQHKQFGLERMKASLSASTDKSPQAILQEVTRAVRAFVGGSAQSDDLTMLAIRYTPQQFESTLTETLTIKNDVHEVSRLSEFQKAFYAKLNLGTSLARQLRLAVEEAVINVIDYAYPIGTEGDIEIRFMANAHRIKIIIIDSGVAFDPTAKEKADTSLSAEDRQIGGLGILLVREMMDSINYERVRGADGPSGVHTEGKNVLTLIKNLKT